MPHRMWLQLSERTKKFHNGSGLLTQLLQFHPSFSQLIQSWQKWLVQPLTQTLTQTLD